MLNRSKAASTIVAAMTVMLVLILGRGYVAQWDFSYFFVAGTDYVDANTTPAPVFVKEGQGYDGQFFYRLANDPLNFESTAFGVTIDHVPYRVQRIVYPALAWIFSLGGDPHLIPVALCLVNVLMWIGVMVFSFRFCRMFRSELYYIPLLICGLYMSVGRCLSEVTEVFFFMGSVYYLFNRRYIWFAITAALAMISRETAFIAIFPMVITWFVMEWSSARNPVHWALAAIPFIVLFAWKYYVAYRTGVNVGISGSGNLGLPFLGMIFGFKGNLIFSNLKGVLQLVFYLLYFAWQVWLVAMVLRKSDPGAGTEWKVLRVAYIVWSLFAVMLSSAIYEDDWSFVRVFELWNMIGFLLLMIRGFRIPALFRNYSFLLVALTVLRLIARS